MHLWISLSFPLYYSFAHGISFVLSVTWNSNSHFVQKGASAFLFPVLDLLDNSSTSINFFDKAYLFSENSQARNIDIVKGMLIMHKQ